MNVMKRLRQAIEFGKSCPSTSKVTLSVEHAEMLEAELIRLKASRDAKASNHAQFEEECR